jgi:rSAM/selenodomain-associated transferase 1
VGSSEPIVAIVAKTPRAGAVKTRLCPPLTPGEAAALHQAFLEDTVDLVSGLGGVRGALLFTPEADEAYVAGLAPHFLRLAQQGPDLGGRLRQAFAALFATGAPAVVALGADAPTLPPGHVRDALARLAAPGIDVVLGPSEDGGYYLVGMTRPQPALFADIAWSTPAVAAQTRARARAAGLGVAELPPWFDVDVPADLERLDASLASAPARAPRTRAARAAMRAVRHSPPGASPAARGPLAGGGHPAAGVSPLAPAPARPAAASMIEERA